MALFFENFTGFSGEDFAAFEERKQQSNRFNLERLKVREKLEALGRTSFAPLTKAIPGTKWAVTDHVPSLFNQRKVADLSLYLTRNEEQQRVVAPYIDSRVSLPEQIREAGEYIRNLSLYIKIDISGVQIGLRCHSTAYVDVMNLTAAIQKEDKAQEFLELLGRLPTGLIVQIGPNQEMPVTDISLEQWQGIADSATQEQFFISLFQAFDTQSAVMAKSRFQEDAMQILQPLKDVVAFWMWSPDNDHLGLAREIRTHRQVIAGAPAQFGQGDWIRVVSGLFAGRRGKVVDMDHKGVVKVKIGRLIVRLSTDEIKASKRRQGR